MKERVNNGLLYERDWQGLWSPIIAKFFVYLVVLLVPTVLILGIVSVIQL